MKFQTLREAYMARPRVLLVENNPAQQLKLERNLRRNGFGSDLALDGSQGLRLASQRQTYGVLLVSAHIQAERISAIYSSILRLESRALLLVFNAVVPPDSTSTISGRTEDPDVRKRMLDDCTYAFPYLPSSTALATVLARHEVSQTNYPYLGTDKQDFVEEVMGVLKSSRRQ